MFLTYSAIIAGLAGLVIGAHYFVDGAAATAKRLGISPLVIGLTIVALGTSAPELMVSISAVVNDAGNLAVANALGSNLANIGLVLGITALLVPLPIAAILLRREIPLLVLATLGAGICLLDGQLSQANGLWLLAMCMLVFYYLTQRKLHQTEPVDTTPSIPVYSTGSASVHWVIGLCLLIIGAQLLVWGAKNIAVAMGISEWMIGLTLVAVGTSLPELATTIVSALKGHYEMAIGNILGSNLFNLLAVLAVPALFGPIALDPQSFSRDYSAMLGITLLLAVLLYGHTMWRRRLDQTTMQHISRWEGLLLLSVYSGYYYWIFMQIHH